MRNISQVKKAGGKEVRLPSGTLTSLVGKSERFFGFFGQHYDECAGESEGVVVEVVCV